MACPTCMLALTHPDAHLPRSAPHTHTHTHTHARTHTHAHTHTHTRVRQLRAVGCKCKTTLDSPHDTMWVPSSLTPQLSTLPVCPSSTISCTMVLVSHTTTLPSLCVCCCVVCVQVNVCTWFLPLLRHLKHRDQVS